MVEISLSNVQLDAMYFWCMRFIETKYLCSPSSQFCGHPKGRELGRMVSSLLKREMFILKIAIS